MTRAEANKIALEMMQKHLEIPWYAERGQRCLTMRGVQIKRAIAAAILAAHQQGYDEGETEERQRTQMEE